VKSALIYPTVVVFIAGSVITLLLWKVVPIFATLFAGLEVALPLPTRIVIGLSNAVASFALPAVIFLGLAGYGVKLFYGTPQGRLLIDRIILRLPLVGNLMRKISVGMFTRTLGTLISSGVPMLEAMEITARTSGNAVVEKAVLQVRRAIETGRTIVDPLRETGVFPNLVVQMIGVGEQTGSLDAMLQKIADFFEDEVDVAVGDLLTAMEPLIILFLGVVVGGVVISMYLPLFSLIGKLAG
jgi:type IV pilus assembly protein PilC